jgi:colicin import membrane protein
METSPSIHVFTDFTQDSNIGGMVLFSLIVHLAAVSAMLFFSHLSSSRAYYSPVYTVRLVDVLPSFSAAEKKDSKVETLTSPSAAPVTRAEEKEKPNSIATKTKEGSEKEIAEAIQRIRQRKEGKMADSAIERIRQQEEEKTVDAAIERIRKRVTIGSAGAVETGESGTGGASSGFMSLKHKMYYNLIWQRIRDAWVLPEGVLGGRKDVDIQFEKRSGNPHLDESALRAIKKANPLPPLPSVFEEDKFDVGVRFTPADL